MHANSLQGLQGIHLGDSLRESRRANLKLRQWGMFVRRPISFSNGTAIRRSAMRSVGAMPQSTAETNKPTHFVSSLELMRGLQVSEEEFMDTVPSELADEFPHA